ncbi:MAG: TetR/AcrR family transcriptional regulator [Pseudomonadota bacterium]
MTDRPLPTKDRIIRAAATLFASRGYASVGLAEILAEAKAPKGSLYHHFPDGKSDLALAAATWASDGMLKLIAASFEPAESFHGGVTTLAHKLAKLFDLSDQWDGCPVSATLFDGPPDTAFRARANHLFQGWINEVTWQAERFGMAEPRAREAAETLFILLEGSWQLARARGSSDVLRALPNRIGDLDAPGART